MFTSLLSSRVIGVGGVASSAPSTQASSLIALGDRTLRLTRGNGARVLVVMKSGGAVDAHPSDNTSYSAGAFGAGTQIGTGNYVVYNGTDASGVNLIISGLTYGVNYGVRAYEFNGLSGAESYNVNTATDNPITWTMPAEETWYLYHATPLVIRKDFATNQTNRSSTQNYPICQYENSDYYFVLSVNEGIDGQDRTVRLRKSKVDGLPLTQGWSADTPPDALGDAPSLLDGVNQNYPAWASGTTYGIGDTVRHSVSSIYDSLTAGNQGNNPSSSPANWAIRSTVWDQYQCWAMGVIDMGGTNRRLYYCANSGSAQRYSVGFLESSDSGETWTRYSGNPVITQGSGKAYYYFHPMKDGSNWYGFAQNYNAAQLQENHLYVGEIHTSSDGITWAKISSSDLFAGRGLWGAIDVSQPWKDGARFYAYISYNKQNIEGSYFAHPDGHVTTYPVGDTIALISWTSWANFASDFIIEREIFTASQAADIDARTWCAPLTFGSDKFVWHMSFQWWCQTLLTSIGQNEPTNCGKILTTAQINTLGYQFVDSPIGSEAYPSFVDRFIIPHQSWLDDTQGGTPVQPKEIISGRTLSIVGTPLISRLRGINANAAGFIQDAEALTYSNYLAVKVAIDKNTLSASYGICGMDTDVGGGTRGWRIMKSAQYQLEIYVYGSNTTYKQYRLSYATLIGRNDSSQLLHVGFVFRNGTLKVCLDVLTDCEAQDASKVTKVRDDSFSAIQQTSEPLRVGAVYPTTNNPLYAQGVVGPVLVMVGDTHATESNWLLNELI